MRKYQEKNASRAFHPVKVICIEDEKGLDALAQLGVLEAHVWGAPADDVRSPDRIIFDLDPEEDIEWKDALKIRLDRFTMKTALDHLRRRKTDVWKGYFKALQGIQIPEGAKYQDSSMKKAQSSRDESLVV